MAGKNILETERLLLREFDEGDAAAYYLLGSDPAIIRYTHDPDGGLKSVEHAREVLRAHPLADYQQHGFGRWACVLKSSGKVIGFAGLKYLYDLAEVDIGYRLLPAHWGTGLATEAGRAVIDYGFNHLRLERIIGLVDPENAASVKVLEKLGLKFVGEVEFHGTIAVRATNEPQPTNGRLKATVSSLVAGIIDHTKLYKSKKYGSSGGSVRSHKSLRCGKFARGGFWRYDSGVQRLQESGPWKPKPPGA